jgi:hypothetical protein
MCYHVRVKTLDLYVLSSLLETRQEINGLRIRRSDLLDKLCAIAITVTQKQRLPGDATWLVCRLLVLSWAAFFCSQLCSVRLWSGLRSKPVTFRPVASVFVAAGTARVLVFISVVTVCYVCVVSERLPSKMDNSLSGSTVPGVSQCLPNVAQQWSVSTCCPGHAF